MRTLTLITIALLLCQCTKRREVPDTVQCSFANNTGQRVILDRYALQADYRDMVNRLSRDTIEASKAVSLAMKIGSTVWVDWYTEDYSFSNWISHLRPLPEMKIPAESQRFDITIPEQFRDTSRSILLNNTDLSSTWELSSPANEYKPGKHRFVFYRDFTGVHTYTPLSGPIQEQAFNFSVHSSQFSSAQVQLSAAALDADGSYHNILIVHFNSMTSTRDRISSYLVSTGTHGPFDMYRQ